jgi:RimJ/RimL family protein N-acetyltransferase
VHDQVVEVVLHRARWTRVRDDLLAQSLSWTKRRLGAVGVSPAALRSALKSLQRANAASLWRKFVAWVDERREYRVYFADRTIAMVRSHDARVQRNSLTDLINFEPAETWQTREAFLSAALSRLKSGEFVYTLRVGDRLACVGWMVRLQSKAFLTEVQQSITFGPGTSTLYDFYTHPDFRGRGFYRALLGHMVCDAFIDDQVNRVCIGVLADNVSSRRAIEASGFSYQGSLYWRQRFGAQTKHADPVFSATEVVDA